MLNRQGGVDSLRSIKWQDFEELAGVAYRRKGYTVTETGDGWADGGVDLVLRKGGEKIMVQCKHWKMVRVGAKVVRQLYGVIAAEGASGGILVTSGKFTQEARDLAKGKTVDLIDGTELKDKDRSNRSRRNIRLSEGCIKAL